MYSFQGIYKCQEAETQAKMSSDETKCKFNLHLFGECIPPPFVDCFLLLLTCTHFIIITSVLK